MVKVYHKWMLVHLRPGAVSLGRPGAVSLGLSYCCDRLGFEYCSDRLGFDYTFHRRYSDDEKKKIKFDKVDMTNSIPASGETHNSIPACDSIPACGKKKCFSEKKFCFFRPILSIIGTFLGIYFALDLGTTIMTGRNLLLFCILYLCLIIIYRFSCFRLKVRYGFPLVVFIHLFLFFLCSFLASLTRIYVLSHVGLDLTHFFPLVLSVGTGQGLPSDESLSSISDTFSDRWINNYYATPGEASSYQPSLAAPQEMVRSLSSGGPSEDRRLVGDCFPGGNGAGPSNSGGTNPESYSFPSIPSSLPLISSSGSIPSLPSFLEDSSSGEVGQPNAPAPEPDVPFSLIGLFPNYTEISRLDELSVIYAHKKSLWEMAKNPSLWASPDFSINNNQMNGIIEVQATLEDKVHMKLRNQGFSPENIFQQRDNLRRILFYQNEVSPIKEETLLHHMNQFDQNFLNSPLWRKFLSKRVIDPLTGSFLIYQ